MRKLRQKLAKPLLFAIYGAIGCFLAASLLGEAWLSLTRLPPSLPSTTHAIVLLIDSSNSMDGNKLSEVKTAASSFVQRQDLSQNQIALISFGGGAQVIAPLTANANPLQQGISGLQASGGTPMTEGIQAASQVLQNTTLKRDILLFTDGQPDDQLTASLAATAARSQNINIVAVATGGADEDYLAQITGTRTLVVPAKSGNFDQAFQDAEKVIFDRQLVESQGSGAYGLGLSVLRIGVWAGLMALGLALALVIGQNRYLKRRWLTWQEGIASIILGLLTGLAAGAIGQILFVPVATIPLLESAGRVTGWIILGGLTGLGMSLFVPNLKPRRALIGGALGGLLGAAGFLGAAAVFGDVVGRLSGAAILGFFIGLMIALIEQLSRNAWWLTVHWSDSVEQTKVALGNTPIILGSSEAAHVYLPRSQGFTPTTAKIFTEGDRVILEFDPNYGKQRNMKALRQDLENGAVRKLGNVKLEIQTVTDIPQGNHKQLK